MKRKKVFAILALTAVLVFGITIGAGAAETVKDITARLNYGITIKYNNEEQAFYDANGTRVYPISYNGTTYLPVRAVGEMLDLQVDWDQATQTVLLGESTRGIPLASYEVSKGKKANEYYGSFSMGGKTYESEYDVRLDSEKGYALFNLEGKYTTFSFLAGHVDGMESIDAVIQVLVDGHEVVRQALSATALPQAFEIPVEGAHQVQIKIIEGTQYRTDYGISNVLVS